METRAQKTCLEQQSGSDGIEDDLSRFREPIRFKAFIHDRQNVKIAWSRFGGHEASPDKDPVQFSAAARKLQKCFQAVCEPNSSWRRTAEPGLELLPARDMDTDRQSSVIGKFREAPAHSNTLRLALRQPI